MIKVPNQWSDNNANKKVMSRWKFFCGQSIWFVSYLWMGITRGIISWWSTSKIFFAYLKPMYAFFMSVHSIQHNLITVYLHSTLHCELQVRVKQVRAAWYNFSNDKNNTECSALFKFITWPFYTHGYCDVINYGCKIRV